jgi:hypothetical protein
MLQLLPPECDLSAILTGYMYLLALIPAAGSWALSKQMDCLGNRITRE